ncbi:MAG TPA: lysophospholipase [Candidatus Anaerofilum excrementigallinarum]|nr:lysophospholipase [Candidatus Anaerofilum excrementigallinarum]
MLEIRRRDIWFESSSGTGRVAGYLYYCPMVFPRGIVQISHGMCEYIGRYDEFANFLAENGYAVAGNDHLGHGATSGDGLNGYFGPSKGAEYILRDLWQMNQLARQQFPGIPCILLGHSMGSFFARLFAAKYPGAIDGLILSGTAGPNPAVGAGITLSEWVCRTKGDKYVSGAIQKLAFGSYLSRIPQPRTPYDWISRDIAVVDKYATDPKCTFWFTASAFHEMFVVLRAVSSSRWAQRIPKQLPIFLFAGDADPVGDYGKGVKKVEELLRQAGVKDLELKLYPEGRHEMLNEINRDEVYRDVLRWLELRF